MKNNYLEYNISAYGGENITSYINRLFDFKKELEINKLALYASFISRKQSIIVGEFNGVIIRLDKNVGADELVQYVKDKLS